MRRAGDGVFWDPRARGEKAGHEIRLSARGGDDDAKTIERGDASHIRPEVLDLVVAFIDNQKILGAQDFRRPLPQNLIDALRWRTVVPHAHC